MSQIPQSGTRNLLLKTMAAAEFDLLGPYLKRVTHRSGDILAERGAPIERTRFPEGGVAAFLSLAGGQRGAVGLVGCEGMIGVGALLGQRRWSHEVLLRGADSSFLVIDTDRLLDACRQCAALQALLLRFAGNLLLQIARTSMVNLTAPLERRLARWLLLYHDRLEGDEFPITHEEIAIMVGARRASATDILHILEGEQAIRSLRGRILIRDRARLEEIAGEGYGDAEADYREKIGPFGKGPRGSW
jgi:CRP-like cAMP-binding protein